jgi:uncharacterized RDD family membrane protein YckC
VSTLPPPPDGSRSWGASSLLIFLWMLWDPMKQGLYDKAARTIVVRVRP